MTKKITTILIWFVLGSFTQNLPATEIRVKTDRNPVNMNDSFQIIFSTSDNPDGDPDFSPLYKDFEVLNKSQSNQSSWVNGKITKNIQWVIDVLPKTSGVLTIPSINFGRDKSEASSIVINKQQKTTPDIQLGEDLFLLVDVSTKSPYVQQQVIYTVRLYRKVNLQGASLTEPKLADAMIEKLGEDSDYNTQFQGDYYTVTERKYAIFPQKSGKVTIDSLSLTAAVVVGNPRSSFGGFFRRQATRTKKVVSDAVELNIKPIPKSFTGKHWLPVNQLHLQEEWSQKDLQINVGEPLTRTLTLLANGATVGQLPKLNHSPQVEMANILKQYPDQPILKEQPKDDNLIALREEKVALIPSKSGSFQLPAIEIPWWNTQTDKMEIARIEAKTIKAIALQGASQSNPKINPTSEGSSFPAVQDSAASSQLHYGWMGLSAFLALGWLLTVWYFLKGQQSVVKEDSEQPLRTANNGIKDLKKACQENSAVAAKDALIRWGQDQYKVSSLGKLAPFCDLELKNEILALNQMLYSKTNSEWEGKNFWKIFKKQTPVSESIKLDEDQLEPLYRL